MQLKNDNSAETSYELINTDDVMKVAAILKAINHRLRQKMLRIIHADESELKLNR